MPNFYVMTRKGTTPPKYVHSTISSAVAEAKRLHLLLGDDVQILEVIGEFATVEVPVTKTVSRLKLKECYSHQDNEHEDDLPF